MRIWINVIFTGADGYYEFQQIKEQKSLRKIVIQLIEIMYTCVFLEPNIFFFNTANYRFSFLSSAKKTTLR